MHSSLRTTVNRISWITPWINDMEPDCMTSTWGTTNLGHMITIIIQTTCWPCLSNCWENCWWQSKCLNVLEEERLEGVPLAIWTHNFISTQGYKINDNVVYQDNQSAILLEKNSRALSGWCTRHIDIQYFFTNRVKCGDIWIKYCPTADMVADFFTKPLQCLLFRKLCAIILNIPGHALTTDAAASQPGVCWKSGKLCQCSMRYTQAELWCGWCHASPST